jgi:hypothetical protein
MFLNERGFTVYTIISIVLFLALIFILALPSFFNLDKAKNEEDCINNMKLIWVAANDYMKDNMTEFNGDLNILKNTYRKEEIAGSKTRTHYLDKVFQCPENRGSDEQYIVFSKFLVEDVKGTQTLNYGTIVLCPNLGRFPGHKIPKSFYENMAPTEIQNFFLDDMDAIDSAAGPDGQRELDMMLKYIRIWKTDPTALERRRADPGAIRNQVIPHEDIYEEDIPAEEAYQDTVDTNR